MSPLSLLVFRFVNKYDIIIEYEEGGLITSLQRGRHANWHHKLDSHLSNMGTNYYHEWCLISKLPKVTCCVTWNCGKRDVPTLWSVVWTKTLIFRVLGRSHQLLAEWLEPAGISVAFSILEVLEDGGIAAKGWGLASVVVVCFVCV